MKFYRQTGVVNGRPYPAYRELTRVDFQKFCAYCFFHEDELGGQRNFDQDHFEPNKFNGGTKERIFLNLYWSCRDCNGPPNKGSNWPSDAERKRGEIFCDPCHHDPVNTDYKRHPDYSLVPMSSAGEYTIRVLRLNERGGIRDLLQKRENVRSTYAAFVEIFKTIINLAHRHPGCQQDKPLQLAIRTVQEQLPIYEKFINATPFVLGNVPDRIDEIAMKILNQFNASIGP